MQLCVRLWVFQIFHHFQIMHHQGSVLSPLLIIIMLEALSMELRVGVPWDLFFFADDLVIIVTSLEECVARVEA